MDSEGSDAMFEEATLLRANQVFAGRLDKLGTHSERINLGHLTGLVATAREIFSTSGGVVDDAATRIETEIRAELKRIAWDDNLPLVEVDGLEWHRSVLARMALHDVYLVTP